jgi:hypothetical protein
MAFIIGDMSTEEKAELERRGWICEPCPEELRSNFPLQGVERVLIFIDANMFEIMNGPGWSKEPEERAPFEPQTNQDKDMEVYGEGSPNR